MGYFVTVKQRWTEKLIVVYLFYGILDFNKKQTPMHSALCLSLRNPVSEKFSMHMNCDLFAEIPENGKTIVSECRAVIT